MKIRKLVLTALLAASLTAGKTALAFIPNVEVVTLLCASYGYAFGTVGIAASFIFVAVEILIWGLGSWVVSYFIYWPILTLLFFLLSKKGVKKRLPLTAAAVGMTVLFGVLTSLVDVGLFSGFFDNFGERLMIYYFRGIPYYLAQVICNAVLFPTAFPFIAKFLSERGKKLFTNT